MLSVLRRVIISPCFLLLFIPTQLSKSHEEMGRLISNSRKQEAEKDRLQKELKRFQELDGTETIGGIPVSKRTLSVMAICKSL